MLTEFPFVKRTCSCCSGLDKLMLTTQQAKLKQLRRVQLMKSQTHQNANLMEHRQEKDKLDEMHTHAVDTRQLKLKAERVAREANAEVDPLPPSNSAPQ